MKPLSEFTPKMDKIGRMEIYATGVQFHVYHRGNRVGFIDQNSARHFVMIMDGRKFQFFNTVDFKLFLMDHYPNHLYTA